MRPGSYVSCMKCNADLTKEGVKRKRCAGCHSVFYDDVTCQKKDWAIHKTECKQIQRRFIATVRSRCPEVNTMAKLLARPDACGIIARGYNEGEAGFEKNYGLGVFWTIQWMKSGKARPMCMLGMAYTRGHVPHKSKEGVKLLKESIKTHTKEDSHVLSHIAIAQCMIGLCYTTGNGVEINKREAAKWIQMAAENGHPLAQIQLADRYEVGDGVEQSIVKAIMWNRKAAEQGNFVGQFNTGVLLMQRVEATGQKMTPDTVDAKEAVKWFRKGAEQGKAAAERYLGTCFHDGCGVAQDYTEAVFWYRKSADQGDATAQFLLAVCYLNGTGVAIDHQEAMRLFRLSADQGYEAAIQTVKEQEKKMAELRANH